MRVLIPFLLCSALFAQQSLFDGKSMAGWLDPSRKSPPGDSWTIEDGCLKAVRGARIREDLVTQQNFRDFELTFEWKIAKGGNSGVKYLIQDEVFLDADKLKPGEKRFEALVAWELENRRGDRSRIAPQTRGEHYVISFEYQLIDDAVHLDARRGAKYQAGSLYGLVPASRPAAKPVGEFNQARLVVRGKHVEHWLNGVKVVDTMLDSPEVVQGLAARWKGTPVFDLLTKLPHRDCPFSLQHHGDAAWFRNIRVRRLTP